MRRESMRNRSVLAASNPRIEALEPRLLLSGTVEPPPGEAGPAELAAMAADWGDCDPSGHSASDLNADGRVGVGDLGILAGRWSSDSAASVAPQADPPAANFLVSSWFDEIGPFFTFAGRIPVIPASV